MAKSCKGLAAELVKCLSESDCVKVENRSIRDCAGEKSPSVPSECVGLRETYFNCKRGQVRFTIESIILFHQFQLSLDMNNLVDEFFIGLAE
ncbi:Mitochondrial protein pet191 homolog [Linum perenne]